MTPDTSTREFVAVPREATDEMLAAAEAASFGWPRDFARHYKAMIEAAPLSTVPAAPVAGEDAMAIALKPFVEYGNTLRGQRVRHDAVLIELWDHKITGQNFIDLADALEEKATAADLRAFGASDAACYKYPGADQAALRQAYCNGAADSAPTPAPPRIDDAAVERATRIREETECKLLMERGHRPGDYGIASYDEYEEENKEFLRKCMRAALHAAFPTGEG